MAQLIVMNTAYSSKRVTVVDIPGEVGDRYFGVMSELIVDYNIESRLDIDRGYVTWLWSENPVPMKKISIS